ncbi:unnamed protein product [Oppiella nova]|uniref:C2H2-type domain-containing protein n=1 Tax=Oppiella nova TaxID=334625 RepID=A0A7R9LDF2_9ACAR|nr:unnamed protein product [Oppiella nova]CAG2162444.1 unnamed protein product [Oppiella nova]
MQTLFEWIQNILFGCIDVLEAIIERLDTSSVAEDCVDGSDGNDSYGSDAITDPEDGRAVESAPESPLKPESDDKPEVVPEFETIPDPGVDDGQEVVAVDGDAIPVPEASEPTVDELKQKYYNICHDLDDWVKQLDALKGIQSYPRFQCQKYADTPSPVHPSHSQPIRVPPIEYQSGGFTEERIFFKKLSSAEIQRLTNSSPKVITKSVSKSPPKERTKCRFPDCRFVTRRGQLGISEHVKEMHVNSVDTDTGSSSLHCPYPNCQYVTKSGHSLKKNLTKHIQRLHKIKSLNTVKPGFSGQQKGTTLLNKKKTLSCTYSGCHFSTIYGTHNLNRHVMSVHCKQHPITTGSVTPLKADIKVNNIGKSTKSGGKTTGAPLRCTKCSFMTRHGFAKLRNHMIIHNRELAFKCTQCDASFASNKPLFKHKRSVHKSTAPVRAAKRDYKNECDVCHQLFKWPSDMRRHRRKHEINDESKVETPNSRDAEDGQSVWYHECSHENCHFKTDRLGVLQKHVISHIVKKERDINTDEPIDTNTAIKSELVSDDNDANDVDMNHSYVTPFSESGDEGMSSPVKQEFESNEPKVPKTSFNEHQESGESSLLSSRMSLSTRLMKSLFKCDAKGCRFASDNYEDWIKHNDWHQSQENTRIKCIRCPKSYTKRKYLKAHQRLKHHISHDCEVCQQMFKSVPLLEQHMMSAHNMSPEDIRNLPTKTAKKSSPNTSTHKSSADPMLGSELMNMLSKQKPNQSTNDFYVSCPYVRCRKQFKLRALMAFHFNKTHKHIKNESLIHITDESCRCPECGQLYTNIGNMKRHHSLAHKNGAINGNQSEDIMPNINPEIFNTTFPSTEPTEPLSPQTNSYNCRRNGCGKWFDSVNSLRQHLSQEHNRRIESRESVPEVTVSVMPPQEDVPTGSPCLRCDICDLDMESTEELEMHFKYIHFADTEGAPGGYQLDAEQWLNIPSELTVETIVAQTDDNDMITID